MAPAAPAPLTGFLYGLSLISSIVVACIGLSFVVGGSSAGNLIFGIPITNSALAIIDKSKAVGDAYVVIVGVRDITLSFLSFSFTLLRDRRGVGIILLGGIVATIGDALVMLNYSESPAFFISAHAGTGLPMFALCYALLSGAHGGGVEKKMQ